MDIVAVLVALAIGAIAGWLAGLLVEGAGFGLLWNILIGIAGAFMAALLFPRLGLGLTLGGGIVGAIVASTIGAGCLASDRQSDPNGSPVRPLSPTKPNPEAMHSSGRDQVSSAKCTLGGLGLGAKTGSHAAVYS